MTKQRLDLDSCLKQTPKQNIWSNSFQYTGTQIIKDTDPGKMGNKQEWALKLCQVTLLRKFPDHNMGRQKQGRSWWTPKVEGSELRVQGS